MPIGIQSVGETAGSGGRRTQVVYQAPTLYLITSRAATRGRPLIDLVVQALDAADEFRRGDGRLPLAICLREKDLDAADLVKLAEILAISCRTRGADFFVNGRLDIALAVRADGVHLPSQGISPREVRAAAPNLRVGLSTHTSGEVEAAAHAGADFVVFGPVFETPSKQGILKARGLTELSRSAALGVPVLALGGITPSAVEDCGNAGAAGVACIRALLGADDVRIATKAFLTGFAGRNRKNA
jgi:thiamine-phosphate pyrophosphorylase